MSVDNVDRFKSDNPKVCANYNLYYYSLCKKHVRPRRTYYFHYHLLVAERHFHSSSWLSPSNGYYFWKCCTTLWSNSGRTGSSCCEFSSLLLKVDIFLTQTGDDLPYLKWKQVISHHRAAAAIAAGKFKDEIVPVSTKVKLNLQCTHMWWILPSVVLAHKIFLWRLLTLKLVRQNLL